MGVLTDLVLPQFRDWLQENTLSNYLERAPGHRESHYIVTTPPTHTHAHTIAHKKYTTDKSEKTKTKKENDFCIKQKSKREDEK